MKIILLSDRQVATKLDYDNSPHRIFIYKLPLIVIVAP